MFCVGMAVTSITTAAGFGVSGQTSAAATPQANTINQLLNSNNGAIPSADSPNANLSNGANPLPQMQQQGAVPPSMVATVPNQAPQAVPGGNAQVMPQGITSSDSPASQQAFAQTANNMMPLSPEQIKVLHYMFDQSQRAATTYPGTPPRPTSSTVIVNLSPGATPPVIRLRAGYVSSLVFLDSTGQPWPIVAYDLGDPQAFNIAPNQPDGKSNTLLVQALDTYKSGNLAVMLKDQNTPIMLTLLPGQRAIDYRVDLRVPGLGPNAQPDSTGLPEVATPQLVNFLDGVPPQEAKTITVEGASSCQAWLWNNHLFLRTRLTILSPSWISTMSSPDGTHVYELTKTPVVLASQRGSVVQLMIKGL